MKEKKESYSRLDITKTFCAETAIPRLLESCHLGMIILVSIFQLFYVIGM